jgi:hypothetical protein
MNKKRILRAGRAQLFPFSFQSTFKTYLTKLFSETINLYIKNIKSHKYERKSG